MYTPPPSYTATRATLAGLLRHEDPSKRTLLVADDVPMTRKEICAAAVDSPFFRGQYGMPAFKPPAEGAPSLGKVYDTSVSRRALGGWVPRYASFAGFMAAQPPPEEAQEGASAAGAKSGTVTQGRS